MKPALQLKLSQHLALTPQLQQSIKLLQLSTLELNQELERYLLENPLLEREDEGESYSSSASLSAGGEGGDAHGEQSASTSDSLSSEESTSPAADEAADDSWLEGNYPTSGNNGDDEDSDFQEIQAATTTLREHLLWQLGLTQLCDRDRSLVRILIEALDDDGYMTQPLDELYAALVEELQWEPELEPEELSIALKQLQNFDPTGVGARNAPECLGLQLEALPQDAIRDVALRMVKDHLELLANRDFVKLKKLLSCDDEALRNASSLIRSLNPRPGAQFGAIDTRYITPDVVVRKLRGRWAVQINPEAYPRLRINRLYAEILSQQRRGDAGPMNGQLQEARWLIKNVQQRFDTILRVSQAIVDRQRQFFEHGEVAMRPLVLREIADEVGLHESTISRVTTQKYMATPRGIYELKYFFGSHVSTDTGGACSSTAIRALIKQLVSAEDAKKPLSDNQISDLLGRQGIVVARRTIAKYREGLGIPPANLRKTL